MVVPSKRPLPYCILAGWFRKHEQTFPDTHLAGRIVFRPTTVEGSPVSTRTYRVTSDNPGYQPGPASRCEIYGVRDADGATVRLDTVIPLEGGGENGWCVEKCFFDAIYNDAPGTPSVLKEAFHGE